MISVIICSRSQKIPEELSNNIESTINCEFEWVIIDNSKRNLTIFEAYNIGIERSKGAILCFMHDDILIHTMDWGNTLLKLFQTSDRIGLIGVAGSVIKTKAPSAWTDCKEEQKIISIVQHFPNKDKEHWNNGFENQSLVEVVAIDGVFMAMRRDSRFRMNEDLKGFHNYDLNVSLEYKKYGYEIMVTNQVLIEHFSIGNMNRDWVVSTASIHQLYKHMLPLCVGKSVLERALEIENTKIFILKSIRFSEFKLAISAWMDLLILHPFVVLNLKFLLKNLQYLIIRKSP